MAFPQMYAISLGLRADDYYYYPRYLKIDSPISKLHFIAESAKYWGGKAGTLCDQRSGGGKLNEDFIQFGLTLP